MSIQPNCKYFNLIFCWTFRSIALGPLDSSIFDTPSTNISVFNYFKLHCPVWWLLNLQLNVPSMTFGTFFISTASCNLEKKPWLFELWLSVQPRHWHWRFSSKLVSDVVYIVGLTTWLLHVQPRGVAIGTDKYILRTLVEASPLKVFLFNLVHLTPYLRCIRGIIYGHPFLLETNPRFFAGWCHHWLSVQDGKKGLTLSVPV